MTKLLERALAEATKLSELEQDQVARWLLEELGSESRWRAAFAQSASGLERLAGVALAEHEAGETEPLDPEPA